MLQQWHKLYEKSSWWRTCFIYINFNHLTALNLWVSRNRFQSSFKIYNAASSSSNVSFPDCLMQSFINFSFTSSDWLSIRYRRYLPSPNWSMRSPSSSKLVVLTLSSKGNSEIISLTIWSTVFGLCLSELSMV